MQDYTDWIEHLSHPLVLIGFILLLFTALFKAINLNKLTRKSNELILKIILISMILISILGISLGAITLLGLESKKHISDDNVNTISIEQKTIGDRSPSIISNSNVSINYGNKLETNEKNKNISKKSVIYNSIQQDTQGIQSPTIKSGDEVNINY